MCAAIDLLAEYGQGPLTGFALGDLRVTGYANARVRGMDLAVEAIERELWGTGLLFCGVR